MTEFGAMLASWLEQKTNDLATRGLEAELEYDKQAEVRRSSWVAIDSPIRSARLIVWESGEVFVQVGSYEAGEMLLERHSRASSADEVLTLLDGLVLEFL
ncbi:immunity protein TriTu family protein [Kineosporia babensis]|uniref:Uncharacterized protein n=1 Tax=Kineosporia babensis TaxID=499548 RepID=A0A9X1NL73_9ACTN|nr:hypothetical protein [Kineosporia babensis]MCD5317062.1 hypothetical protein [Kineosporia babensis]